MSLIVTIPQDWNEKRIIALKNYIDDLLDSDPALEIQLKLPLYIRKKLEAAGATAKANSDLFALL